MTELLHPFPAVPWPWSAEGRSQIAGLTRHDLEEEARKQQFSSLDQIRWAILEDDGAISIIPKN